MTTTTKKPSLKAKLDGFLDREFSNPVNKVICDGLDYLKGKLCPPLPNKENKK